MIFLYRIMLSKGDDYMKSIIGNKEDAFNKLYNQLDNEYPKDSLLKGVKRVLKDVHLIDNIDKDFLLECFDSVMDKTETFNVLMTLIELDHKLTNDKELKKSMKNPSYNQHRTIAINICDMYGAGATSLFGYIDCTFERFFPNKPSNTFLAKGVSAIIASIASLIISGEIKEDYTEENIKLLASRGIGTEPLIDMIYDLQKPYNPELVKTECEEHLRGVLKKQQTFHTIQLCIKIDRGVESKAFGDQFQAIVGNDEGLYGVDETVNTSVSKLYGMIAITNFGYLDKSKPGIIGELDSDHEGNHCNTFADDTVCAIVAAACARLAYNNKNTGSKPLKD